MEFSETIRFIRRKSLLSQKDFVKTLCVSFSTVSRWKNDRATPQICKLKLINEFCISHDIPFDAEGFIADSKSVIAGTE